MTIDKSTWGEGPWQNEVDEALFTDQATQLHCALVRNGGGAWCGYVGVPVGHPAHGMDHEEVPCDAHGGLTFAGALTHGEPGLIYYGFDCAHSWDFAPAYSARNCGAWGDGTYRDFDYVLAQTRALAAQLAAMERQHD